MIKFWEWLRSQFAAAEPGALAGPTTDTVTIWAAVLGALLAAATGALVQFAFNRVAQRNRDRVLLLTTVMRASIIHQDAAGLSDTFNAALSRANERGMTGLPIWSRVSAIVGDQLAQPLVMEELVPLMTYREYELAQRYIAVCTRHANLGKGIAVFNDLMSEIDRKLEGTTILENGVLWAPDTPEQQSRIAAYTVKLEALIPDLRKQADVLADEALSVSQGISAAAKRHLRVKKFPTVKRVEQPTDIAA